MLFSTNSLSQELMTPFYTNQHTEQAKSNIFGNENIANVSKSLLNNEKHHKNNFTISIARMRLNAYLGKTHIKKGRHERPLLTSLPREYT